jgi:hypothetical protein
VLLLFCCIVLAGRWQNPHLPVVAVQRLLLWCNSLLLLQGNPKSVAAYCLRGIKTLLPCTEDLPVILLLP